MTVYQQSSSSRARSRPGGGCGKYLVIFMFIGLWFLLLGSIFYAWKNKPINETPTPQPLAPTAIPTEKVKFANPNEWVEKTELKPLSDNIWAPRPGLINGSALDTIKDASSMEYTCIPEFMYWNWMSETGQEDCSLLLQQPGANACRSSVGAEGPMQFMGVWNETGPNEVPMHDPGWSISNLHDSTRAACRMWTAINLWDHIDNREAFALRYSSIDVYNAGRVPKYWADRGWNVGIDGYKQALWVWDNATAMMNKNK